MATKAEQSIDGLDFYKARSVQKNVKNATRITKELFLAAGRAADIPKSELGVAADILEMIRSVPPSTSVRTIQEWKDVIKNPKVDNRDLKLALSLAGQQWTTPNEKRKSDETVAQKSPEGTWYCIVRKTELTAAARASYSRKMTHVTTPRRSTPEEALEDRKAVLLCDNVQECLSSLNGGRTSFSGQLGPNLRLEDCRFAVRWDGQDGERRIWFDIKSEAEAAAAALNNEELSPSQKDKLAAQLSEQASTSVVVHAGDLNFYPKIVMINLCPKKGTGATARVIEKLTDAASQCGVELLWFDVREECNCPAGFCLPLTTKNGDDPQKLDKRLDDILLEEPECPVVIMNRGVTHVLKNRHLSALEKRPYWACAFQPCNYNQNEIGEAMVKFLVGAGIEVTVDDLRTWSSEPSELQLLKRFKASGASSSDPQQFVVLPKFCIAEGCKSRPRDHSGRCKAHGGGIRCSAPECTTAAVEGGPPFCAIHGGRSYWKERQAQKRQRCGDAAGGDDSEPAATPGASSSGRN